MNSAVYPLAGNQAGAVDPHRSVWLSASAGTGKTQVLSARVLRLLLREDVMPSQVLCLTFTKAGASEMANRINAVLASWVRMPDEYLAKDLHAIGAEIDPATRQKARRLFASVLDSPGGGLRINTIHAFCQWLIGSFAHEAGVPVASRAMDDRDKEQLAQEVLTGLISDWQHAGPDGQEMLNALEMLSVRLDHEKALNWLLNCAAERPLWFGAGAWGDDVGPRLRHVLGLESDADAQTLERLCADDAFPCGDLRMCLAIIKAWGTASAAKLEGAITQWMAFGTADRSRTIGDLKAALFTQKDEVKWRANLIKIDPAYTLHAERVLEGLDTVFDLRKSLELLDTLTPLLRLGRRFALAWDAAKKMREFVDFDDLIYGAAELLMRSDMRDWIKFKLDRQFDHILLDEAQDTNKAQWQIISALADDFFSGRGQKESKIRTIFVVGDYKQAIFGFQGTSPENFVAAQKAFAEVMAGAAHNSAQGQGAGSTEELLALDLGRSYRTSAPILNFVDQAIAAIGPENIGLTQPPSPHSGDEQRPGIVAFWRPLTAQAGDFSTDDDHATDGADADADSARDAISKPERRMADKIALQIRDWLANGYPLYKGVPRNAGPGDIMVLVRNRRELAGLIVARLYALGVPVAGVDRLRLGAPLAVKDIMAAMRFAVQPADNLSLANLLSSPLIGWSHDDIMRHCIRDKSSSLWDHLNASADPFVSNTVAKLRELLARVDFEPVPALIQWILIGPWQGRRAFFARLGPAANDAINEFYNAAESFCNSHNASLLRFIHWFDAGDGDIKRDADSAGDLVRVMTVHGSKGLQAPIVILADATAKPDDGRRMRVALADGEERHIPLPPIPKEQRNNAINRVRDRQLLAERQEHWRLLYVAMTRAEEALFIGGALGQNETEPSDKSWYGALLPIANGGEEEDPIWGGVSRMGIAPQRVAGVQVTPRADNADIPQWAAAQIGPEPQPSRPLSPSKIAIDETITPPFSQASGNFSRRRGTLIHGLLERLPEIAEELRRDRAQKWLIKQAGDLTDGQRAEIEAAVIALCENPNFAAIFGPNALAEVPISANYNGQTISGTIDRLIIDDQTVTVIDFKTGYFIPKNAAEIAVGTMRQMAAYVAALRVIYPEHSIAAGVVYTHGPVLHMLPEEQLAPHIQQLHAKDT